LILVQAAYWLMIAVREAAAGTPWERAQVSRIREQLIKVGAQVKETVRRVWVHLATSFRWQEVFGLINARLAKPRFAVG